MMDFVTKPRPHSQAHLDDMYQPSRQVPEPAHHQPPPPPEKPPKRKHVDWANRSVRIELFIITLASALLLIALSAFLASHPDSTSNTSSTSSDIKTVDPSRYQAVFLAGGTGSSGNYSTYFGHIRVINDTSLILDDVFFLAPTNSKNTSQTTLSKVGCDQLHAPDDTMVINRSQIAYWQNLQSAGKVTKAIAAYKKKFPLDGVCKTSTKASTTTPATTTPSTTTTP